MDINSWKKAQRAYIKLLTVLPPEEEQHFYFDFILLYYFKLLYNNTYALSHEGYIYILLVLKNYKKKQKEN